MAQAGAYDRTKKSIRNSVVAVSLQVVSLLIGFWSRRIFLNHLGTEILGLNTTATSLLNFLNLAELGIGSAIAVTLYKPIFDDDKQSIKEIVALQGWLYRIIALIVIGGSVILSFFFPMIFSKTTLPLWYAYASFGVLLYGSLLGYFFNYKQILLDAHQLNYKIQLSVKLISIFKLIAQALTIKFLDNGYIWWLVLEAVFATIIAIVLSRTVNKTFPYIAEKVTNPAELRHKYPEVVTKVKQLFVHKIAGFVITQTTPLIIYAFASLTLVAKYGNYLIFTNNLNAILSACFIGLTASVGNMIASDDKNLTIKVFRELFSIRFLMATVCSICLWFLVDPFIKLWIGPEYILDKSTLLLIVIGFYIQNSRGAVDVFKDAYGLFSDVWAPIAESVLCLGLAVLGGHFWGLNGILGGYIVGEILIVKIWKPIFLFRHGLRQPIVVYIWLCAKHLLAAAVSYSAIKFITLHITINQTDSYGNFFLYALILFLSCSIFLFTLLYVSEVGMSGFIKRLTTTLKKAK
ncbi:MAG: sugar transporter [Bacteroidales bacterium]|nr:sugar transporter [Bacteroidales bacterium]